MKIANLIILLALTITSSSAIAQVRKVGISRPSYHSEETFIPIYEYDEVDVQPKFPGGERGLINFINKTKEYPHHAYEHRIKGRVVCSFIINPDGSISNVQVVKGVEESLNREAMRIVRAMPKWKAGEVDNENVHVRCFLPIAFRL